MQILVYAVALLVWLPYDLAVNIYVKGARGVVLRAVRFGVLVNKFNGS